ncbi:neural cell adhesion molecule L1-like, partial [Scomber scombrus]
SQPPVLTTTLTSFTAFSPEDLYLPCEATGNPTPTFRWVKDQQEFSSQTGSGTLRVDEDEPLDSYEGFYRCYASNTLGTAMTQRVHIIVEPQPVLLKQQKVSKSAYEGDSLILTCDPPKSSTPPHIHWMDNRMVHITQSDRVVVGIDGKLYFSNVMKSDSRDDYICNAQYSAARTILPETAVRLTVLPSQYIQLHISISISIYLYLYSLYISSLSSGNNVALGRKPHFLHPTGSHTTVLALQGQSLFLECIPTGLPTPKVEWTKKDGNLDEMSRNLELYNRRLHFHHVSQEHDGEYECRASNTHGHAKHSFTLTVEAAPYWVKQPQALLYSPGETVRLDCQADGIPTPNITWSINGQSLSEVDDDPRRSITGSVLRLADIEFTDTAVYQCEATNRHGSIILNTYLYVVELPPQILSSDAVVYRVTEGGNIELHCESFGSPRPHVTWEREDTGPLLSDPRISQLTNGTLQLSDVSHDDSDVFTCSVQHSNISITAHLEVYNRTVIRTRPQDVRVLRGSSAMLDCDFYRDPGLKHYQIIWRRDGHKLHESSPDDKYTIFENGTLKVTDIQSDDTAPYSCEVITDLDHVKEAGSITVVARPDPPSDLSLSEVADHSLTLSWTPGNAHNSPVTEFIVQSREEQHSEEGDWRWEEWKRVPGDVNSLQLTLHPYCTYRFRVIAANELGHSEPSGSSESHSTPPAVPASNPTGVRSDSTDPGSLIITWDEMHKRLHHGQSFQYKVSWREAGGPTAPWSYSYVRSPPIVVNGTGTYTPFEIKVQAVNTVGAGPEPEPEIGHSGEDAPEEPPGGVAVTVMNSTVRVMWNEAQRVRGLLLGYKIHVWKLGPKLTRDRRSLFKKHHEEERRREGGAERGKQKEEWRKEVVVHGMKTSAEVTGLLLFSLYELTVSAFNRKGDSPPSPAFSFSTPEGVPGPPASLWFESPSEKSLVLHWEPPAETNGILVGYMLQYQEESRDSSVRMQTIDDPSTTHMVFDGLDPTLHYIFNVIARTKAGDGPPITRRVATLLDGVPPSNISVVPGNTFLNLSWVPGERDRNY